MRRALCSLAVGALLGASTTVAVHTASDPNAESARYAVEHSGVPRDTLVGPRTGYVVHTPVHLNS